MIRFTLSAASIVIAMKLEDISSNMHKQQSSEIWRYAGHFQDTLMRFRGLLTLECLHLWVWCGEMACLSHYCSVLKAQLPLVRFRL
jgi:hypothetical protein